MRPPLVFLRGLLAFALIAAFEVAAWAQLPTPVLSSVFPPGGKIGATLDITVSGSDIDDLESMAFSHPGIKATLKMAPPDDFSKKPKRMAM